ALPAGWTQTTLATDGGWLVGDSTTLSSEAFKPTNLSGNYVLTNDDKCDCNKSADRLISPKVTLPANKKAYLSADMYFFGQEYQNVGEKGTIDVSIDNKATWQTVKTVNGSAGWRFDGIDLTAYAGKSIYVSFKYNDGGGWLYGMALDNVKIYEPVAGTDVALTQLFVVKVIQQVPDVFSPTRELVGKDLEIVARITNFGTDTIKSFNFTWSDGTNTHTDTIDILGQLPVNVPPLASVSFASNYSYTVLGGAKTITGTISSVNNGKTEITLTNNSFKDAITGVIPNPDKHVMVEQRTGTWCTWCPRGHVYLDYMQEYYKGYFIGIAAHNGTNDPMKIAEHDTGLNPLSGGFPTMILERKNLGDIDPTDIENPFLDAISVAPNVKLNHSATIDLNTRLATVDISATFQKAFADLKLASIIVEDSVHGTTAGYNQVNSYAGGNVGVMGGYDVFPNPVPAADMYYNAVSRYLLGGFGGKTGSLPATIAANATHTYQFASPAIPSTQNIRQMKVVTFVLNKAGEVINAVETPLAINNLLKLVSKTTCVDKTVPVGLTTSTGGNTFSWAFGANASQATATGAGPFNVKYSTSGKKVVALKVVNATTGTYWFYDTITVKPIPDAAFTAAKTGNTINFTNTSKDANSYEWTFGDNTTINTEKNPSHLYTQGGSYTVQLIITGDCGKDTVKQTLNLVQAAMNIDAKVICLNKSVVIKETSLGSPDKITFDFGKDAKDNSFNGAHKVTYTSIGKKIITLTVSNSFGTSTIYDTVLVKPLPKTNFTYGSFNTSVVFTNTSINATTYLWSFDDGTSSTENAPTHQFATAGTHLVSLFATGDCGTDTLKQTITIKSVTANFAFNKKTICLNETLNVSNQSLGDALQYNWNFGTGATKTALGNENYSVQFDSPGKKSITLSVTNANGTSTYTDTLIVLPLPTVAFDYTYYNKLATFKNTTTNTKTYTWTFGDNTTSTDANPTHTYTQAGIYTVILVATGECGSVSATKSVEIKTVEAAFAGKATLPCEGQIFKFSSASVGDNLTYDWNFGAGATPATSTQSGPIDVTYSTTGQKTVTLIVKNANGDAKMQNNYTIYANPKADFSSTLANGTLTTTNLSTNAKSYDWNFGDAATSIEQSPIHKYTQNGTYSVSLKANSEFCGTSEKKTSIIVNIVGTEDAAWKNFHAQILPNPNDGHFILDLKSDKIEAIDVQILDTNGKLITKRTMQSIDHQAFNLEHLAKGIYLVRLKKADGEQTMKLVVE
ncbi:MAG: hypothetical protein RLZZ292_2149, partial [Bacteroidota bacterium]